jgi:hypothetical protein
MTGFPESFPRLPTPEAMMSLLPAARRARAVSARRLPAMAAMLAVPLLSLLAVPLLVLLASPGSAAAVQVTTQDTNILFPVEYIKQRLRGPIVVSDMERTRQLEEDRSRRVTLVGEGGEPDIVVHWKPVAAPGEGFNNEPRYELAAYRFQTLFLDEPDYVVPPTVLRAMPIEQYREHRTTRGPTIRGTQAVLFLLSYWVQHLAVDTVDPFDQRLFEHDPIYAQHFANANLLTHLIDHKDGNHGNVVVSLNTQNRRVFALDNDVAFRSRLSDQGDRWRRLHVDRLPASSVERLRALTRDDLDRELGVVAEFEIVDGQLHAVEPGPNLRPGRGLRVQDGRVQFGLTSAEITDLERRIERLLRDVDRGRISNL